MNDLRPGLARRQPMWAVQELKASDKHQILEISEKCTEK